MFSDFVVPEMETTLYSDGVLRMPNQQDVQKKKASMSLDFTSPASSIGPKKKAQMSAAVLGSPDLNMLKLASPELEKLIISQSGNVQTTPTPTQVLFPKSVTAAQEAYARGFVDALDKLHHQKNTEPEGATSDDNSMELDGCSDPNPVTGFVTLAPVSSSALTATTQMTSQPTSYATTTCTPLPGSILPQPAQPAQPVEVPLPVTVVTQFDSRHTASPQLHELQQRHMARHTNSPLMVSNSPAPTELPAGLHHVQVKEEQDNQIVPCGSIVDSPAMSPINMDDQEELKLDRKRARNRVAARKCRERKLARIARLEERVSELKGQNTELTKTATSLRDQVCQLKKQIMAHVNEGCQVMLSPNLL